MTTLPSQERDKAGGGITISASTINRELQSHFWFNCISCQVDHERLTQAQHEV